MTTEEAPNIIEVPVKRYDVNLTLDDILTPLMQMSERQRQARTAAAPSPELDQLLQQLGDLARQLKEVVNRVNQADPTLLTPTRRE
jgi:hypothetical protein